MLLSEYVTLQEVGLKMIPLGTVSPSVHGDFEFLFEAGLVVCEGNNVSISARGEGLLAVEPYSRSDVVVSFDAQKLQL